LKAHTRKDAVASLLDLLEAHSAKTEETKRLTEQIYAFQTPDRPVFRFDVGGYEAGEFTYERSSWVRSELDGMLDHNMQRARYQLENLPESDSVPVLHPGEYESLIIPRMFCGDFDVLPDGGGSTVTKYGITDLERDLPHLPDVDPVKTETGARALERVRFLAEETQGKVLIAYPQLLGPMTNAMLIMPQTEMLIATRTCPELLRVLMNRISQVTIQMIQAMQEAVGASVLRPRYRFYQPEWVRGLFVDDYVSVVRPEDYLAVCADAFGAMYEAVGPIYLHTCGPVMQCADMLTQLPGLKAFETTYVVGTEPTTTRHLEELKERVHGRLVLSVFEDAYYNPVPVSDEENFTASWLERMSQGGGFIAMSTGTVKQGRGLLGRLGML